MILFSGLELKKKKKKKSQTDVSKHLRIFPKIKQSRNSAMVWIKTASSVTIIVYLKKDLDSHWLML